MMRSKSTGLSVSNCTRMSKRHHSTSAGWFVFFLFFLLGGCATRNASTFGAETHSPPLLLAHRGVSQTYPAQGVTDTTCTADRIYPPTHALLENTLASIEASLKAGASIVEIDVHPTTDGEFAVFHDWTLECRTDGRGRTRDHNMLELKALDIGYGYTADQGKTFPFRGKGVGQMPSLAEVLHAFPVQALLINVKSRSAKEGEQLADYLLKWPRERRKNLAIYGDEIPISIVRTRVSDVLTMSRDSLKACLLGDVMIGWSGAVPWQCEKTLVLVPISHSKWLWGWPNAFVQRMEQVGSRVFVMGAYQGGPSRGIDSIEELDALPPNYRGGIWTNEIELIGRAVAQRRSMPSVAE